jgi:ferrous iron transport protein B
MSALLHAHEDAELDIASGRYEWIGRMVRAAVKQPRLGEISLTDRLDRYAVHPIWGMAILVAVFTVIFGLTFQLASPIQQWWTNASSQGCGRGFVPSPRCPIGFQRSWQTVWRVGPERF